MAALENVHCEHYFNYHVGVRRAMMHNKLRANPGSGTVSEPNRTEPDRHAPCHLSPLTKGRAGQGRAAQRRVGNLQQLRAGAAADVKIMFSPACFPFPSSPSPTLILAVSHFQFYDLQRVDNSFICFLRVIIAGGFRAQRVHLAQHRERERE